MKPMPVPAWRVSIPGAQDAHAEIDAMLARIQNDLFDLGADLSTPDDGQPLSYEPCALSPRRFRASKRISTG